MDDRDAGVLVIRKTLIKDGWRSEMIRVHGRSKDVFVSPDGLRYVRALDTEAADLIVETSSKKYVGSFRTRLRLEQGSATARAHRREQRLINRGEKQREARVGFEPADSIKQTTKHVRRKR